MGHCFGERDHVGLEDAFAALPGVLDRMILARIWPGSVYPDPPPHKRRHGVALAKVDEPDALRQLRQSIRVLAEPRDAYWMTWPKLALELVGDQTGPPTMVGYLPPGWVRLEAAADRQLVDPDAMTAWIQAWTPHVASAL
jgi:hypothetical protein